MDNAITLNPAETFTINRILKDHTDSTTYYVQAIVYNADTRAVINTLNLTDNGSRWFSKAYKVPYDNVYSTGKRIVIVTSVFTDSGYTTKSQNHGDEPCEYLIAQRWNPASYIGGNSEAKNTFDEGKFKEILKTEVTALLKPLLELEPLIPPEEPEPLDVAVLVADITRSVAAELSSRLERPDLSPVLSQLALLKSEVEKLPHKETNLTPIAERLDRVKNELASVEMRNAGTLEQVIVPLLEKILAPLIAENKKISSFTNAMGGTIHLNAKSDEEELAAKRKAYLNKIMAQFK